MACEHRKGDFFRGVWVCASCYRQLSERPRRYVLNSLEGDGLRPQEVIVAEIATYDGQEFGKFLGWMVSYLRMRSLWSLTQDHALRECLSALKDMGEPYGARSCHWSKADAKELVNEFILSYWDESGGGNA